MYGTKLVTWQRPDGGLIKKLVNYNDYYVGKRNAYKWEVIDIKYWTGKKFVSKINYEKYIHREATKHRIIHQFKSRFLLFCRDLSYISAAMIIYKILFA